MLVTAVWLKVDKNVGMQRYHFFRSDPIRSRKFWVSDNSDPIRYQRSFFFFLINVEFLYFCVTLLCVKHNLLDNLILMKNNMKKYRGCLITPGHFMHFVI